MTGIHHTILGLPKSGKTTFLAALYHLVDSGEVQTNLRVSSYSGDQTYLNSIVRSWLECKEVTRTSQALDTNVELHLVRPTTGRAITLAFPDLGGESFETQVEQRRCRQDYVDGCNLGGGILLFVSPDRRGDEEMTIVEGNAIFGAPATGKQNGAQVQMSWSPNLVPSQVKLVELLQFMEVPPFARRRRRVAVIISAWDLVPNRSLEPRKWIETEMPLLYQFLMGNPGAFDTRFYGVSALGGDIKDEARRRELMAMTHSARIMCVGPNCSPHDLTVPISWLTPEENGVD